MSTRTFADRSDVVEKWQRHHSTGLLTILFTDIVGSTALKQRLGDRAGAESMQKYREIVRSSLAGFAGSEEIETAGDSFLIIFRKPSEAVRFAIFLQARLRQLRDETGAELHDRAAVHVGEVVIEEHEGRAKPKDLFGIQLDLCARVLSLAGPSQILLTRFAFDNARQVLKGEDLEGVGKLFWMNHGPYLLKGFDESLEICEVGELGLGPGTAPAGNEKAQRRLADDSHTVAGWRPAIDQLVPNTKWRLENKLGEGGFGEVWLGCHEALKDRRVFKFCFRPDRIRALKREVTLFRLMKSRIGEHPNVVNLREVYFDEPPYYIEMDYVQGKDLQSWCRQHGGVDQVPLETRLEIVAQIADGLQTAHEAGVIHRDIKPGNILLGGKSPQPGDVQAKLSDFGIGQVLSEEYLAGVTKAGFTQTLVSPNSSQSGTHLYMAPELIAGEPASIQSDLYSLGVVLFQLLAGDLRLPVTVDWARSVPNSILREDLEHCFCGDPKQRFASASLLARNLRSLRQREEKLLAQQAAAAARERAAYRRGLVRAAGVAVVLVAAFAGLALFAWGQARNASRNAEAEADQRQLVQEAYREVSQALNQIKIQRTEELFATDPGSALAHLALHLREEPTNRLAGIRLVSALSQRNFSLPVGAPLQHSGKVNSMHFSPDGIRILTASDDKTVRIWHAQTAEPAGEPLDHMDSVTLVRSSPDGRLVATGSADGSVWLFDAASGRVEFGPFRHDTRMDTRINALRFSPDGRILASGDSLGMVRLWETLTGQPLAVPIEHADTINSAEFSRQGDRLVTASMDDTARVWDVRTGSPVTPPIEHQSGVLMAQFSPDGTRFVTASADRTARIWDAATGQPRSEALRHGGEVNSARFSPDAKWVLTSSLDNTARLWDASTVEPVFGPFMHREGVVAAEFSRDGQFVVTASLDKTARVWEVKTGLPWTEPIPHPAEVFSAYFNPAGRELATLAGNEVFLWDIRPGQIRPEVLPHAAAINAAAWSPDGTKVLSVSDDKTARIWTWADGNVASQSLLHDQPVRLAAWGRTGEWILTAAGSRARVWNAETRQLKTELNEKGTIWAAQLSPEGTRVALGTAENQLSIWDLGKPEAPLRPPPQHSAVVWNVQFSPDGRWLATASADRTARLWNAATGQPQVGPLQHEASVRPIQFSPDGQTLATGSTDRTARLWHVTTGQPLAQPLQHGSEVLSVQFSPAGLLLVTASADQQARVWEVQTGRLAIPPIQCGGVVWFTQFSPDGKSVVTASADKKVRIWDVSTGLPVSEPYLHDSEVQWVGFSPDGGSILTVAGSRSYRWSVPKPPEDMLDTLVPIAEAVAGEHFTESGLLEPMSWDNFLELRSRLRGEPERTDSGAWARWFVADRVTREKAPGLR